jgi:LacI family repressor for deo operon, udp, cdd, tsx, nupC, and nupG
MANMRSIAERAGVSLATASRALNNLPGVSAVAREAVLAAANRAGYVPEVGRRSASNIALFYAGVPTPGDAFDAALLAGVYQGLEASGLDLMILDAQRSRGPGETFSQMFLRKGVQGALVRTTSASGDICRELVREGFAAVVVGSRIAEPGVGCIYSDSREASREAVEHLIGLGHRQIAVCVHVVDDSDHTDRVAGYRQALKAHGIPFDQRLVLRVPAERSGGVQAIRRLATLIPRPTAIYLTDPLTCMGALAEARRTGVRIPEDLSVVGFDDADIRQALVPQLTAVCQNAVRLGQEAVAMLGKRLANSGGGSSQKVLPCWLEVQDSTAPPTTDQS